jgi:HK97 family phage portal protein
MGLISSAFTWLKNLPPLLAPTWGARRAMAPTAGRGNVSTPWMYNWSDDRVAQVRRFSGFVYIAAHRIATTVACRPPNVSVIRYPGDPGHRERFLPRSTLEKALTPLLSHEDLEIVPQQHPLCRLLADPNEPDTAYDLFYSTIVSLCLTGVAYWWAPSNPLGKPAALWCLPPQWVRPRVGRDGALAAYELWPTEGVTYTRWALPASDVIFFRFPSPLSIWDGYSPLTACSKWADTGEAIDRAQWFTFKNGIFPGVGVEFDPGVKMPSEPELDRIEARLMARYSGEHNSQRPILIPPGAKLKPLQLTPSELMFIESADQQRDKILAAFGVPLAIAQPDSATSAGAALAAQSAYYANTVNPLLRFFGMHLTEKLARTRYQSNLRIWWEDRTPQDPELLERQLNTDLAYCSRSPNEVRALRGLEPYPEPVYNRPFTPLNTLPIDEALRHHQDRQGSQGTNRDTRNDAGNSPRGGEAPDRR